LFHKKKLFIIILFQNLSLSYMIRISKPK